MGQGVFGLVHSRTAERKQITCRKGLSLIEIIKIKPKESEMDSANFSKENYTTTPLKSDGGCNNSARRAVSDRGSSNLYKTPVRCNESVMKRGKLPRTNSHKSNLIKKMPIYSPTMADSTGHVKNPFEHARLLKERLSQPFCSPSLFEKIVSPAKNDDQFNWSIEDISILRPAPINENPIQDFDSWFSPATESEAQQAIDKFFSSQIVNMESPIDVRQSRFKSDKPVKVKQDTTETWSQTMLSFPPNLPPEIEKVLSAYCTFNDNQFIQDKEDLDSSNCSISRKKLSFESEQSDMDSLCITPVQTNNKCSKQTVASTPITSVLTSPEISPIVVSKVQDSPMDISVSYRSKTRLSLTSDVDMNEKENEQMMSWHHHGSMAIHQCDQSPDSAFSSV